MGQHPTYQSPCVLQIRQVRGAALHPSGGPSGEADRLWQCHLRVVVTVELAMTAMGDFGDHVENGLDHLLVLS